MYFPFNFRTPNNTVPWNSFVYYCVLLQDVPEKDEQLIPLALNVAANPFWAIIMLGGGHFAAGIFQGLALYYMWIYIPASVVVVVIVVCGGGVFIHISKASVNAVVDTLCTMALSQQRPHQTSMAFLNIVLLDVYKEHLHHYFIFKILHWILNFA